MGTAIVSIAQSRQTSFQRNDGYIALGNGSSFNRPIASNLFPTGVQHHDNDYQFCVSIAQSRQTSFQRLLMHSRKMPRSSFNRPIASNLFPTRSRAASLSCCIVCFNRPIASNLFPTQRASPACASRTNTFQSPNRVKPLSNVLGTELPTEQGAVSIAQSRQTSFQRSFVFVTKR